MPEVGSWVIVREAGPQLIHPKKYAKLCDVWDIHLGVALLEQFTSPSCQGNDYFSKDGDKVTRKINRYWW